MKNQNQKIYLRIVIEERTPKDTWRPVRNYYLPTNGQTLTDACKTVDKLMEVVENHNHNRGPFAR